MEQKKIRCTMLLPKELSDKMEYIGLQVGRTKIRQIRYFIREAIRRFEAENGEIIFSSEDE